MIALRTWITGAALVAASFVSAGAEVPKAARDADIVFLGEVHYNRGRHARQAESVRDLAPVAGVFEMLPPGVDASAIAAVGDGAQALARLRPGPVGRRRAARRDVRSGAGC